MTADVLLYGNGGVDVHYRVVQGSVDVLPAESNANVTPAPAARAQELRPRGLQTVEIASAIVGAVMTRVLDNEGDVRWEIEQMRGMKAPGDIPADGQRPVEDHRVVIKGPHATTVGGLDEIYADFRVDYQTDGRAVGNVQVTPEHTEDAVGLGLTVKATIMDDARTYRAEGSNEPFAALKIRFQYRWDSPLYNDLLALADVALYGSGDHGVHYEWTQV